MVSQTGKCQASGSPDSMLLACHWTVPAPVHTFSCALSHAFLHSHTHIHFGERTTTQEGDRSSESAPLSAKWYCRRQTTTIPTKRKERKKFSQNRLGCVPVWEAFIPAGLRHSWCGDMRWSGTAFHSILAQG